MPETIKRKLKSWGEIGLAVISVITAVIFASIVWLLSLVFYICVTTLEMIQRNLPYVLVIGLLLVLARQYGLF